MLPIYRTQDVFVQFLNQWNRISVNFQVDTYLGKCSCVLSLWVHWTRILLFGSVKKSVERDIKIAFTGSLSLANCVLLLFNYCCVYRSLNFILCNSSTHVYSSATFLMHTFIMMNHYTYMYRFIEERSWLRYFILYVDCSKIKMISNIVEIVFLWTDECGGQNKNMSMVQFGT